MLKLYQTCFSLSTMLQGAKVILHSKNAQFGFFQKITFSMAFSVNCFIAFW